MTPEVRSRIFEPFYTTKDMGHGTGLGLAAVYGIVKQLGGYIFVSSEPGRGSVFTIYLPRTDRPVEVATHRVRNAAPVGNETILLVEDEDSVRSFARKVLERYGYRVIEAASGEAALTQVDGHAGPIHLLLTDVMLAGMDGGQLARHVCRERTDTRVLFMSGYTDANRASLPFGAELLEKPFSANTLLSSVRQALEVEKGV
jgi:CheY-like chemotaxis protein